MDEYDHLDAAVRRLRRRFVGVKRLTLALDVCLGGALASLLATVMLTLGGWSGRRVEVYAVILAGTIVVFGLLAWRVRVSALAVLQCADRVLHFQERLSTAYEYLRQAPDNPFVPGLIAEAERVAPQAEPGVVFPLQLPRRAWGVPVLLMAIIGFSMLQVAPLQFGDGHYETTTREVVREGKRLERWGRRLEALARQRRLDRSFILARHMQHLGRRLQRDSSGKSQVVQRISTLAQYLQRMQQELRERALMSEVGAMVARDTLISHQSLKRELQDILALLQREALPREMTTVAEQEILRLSRQLGQNPPLEQLLRNLHTGNIKAARRLLQDLIRQQQTVEELQQLERARRALEYASRTLQRGGEAKETPGDLSGQKQNKVAGNTSVDSDGETMAEDMPTLEEFTAPGFDEGFGTSRRTGQGPPRHLHESEQSPSQVRVNSGKGPIRFGYVRYLPVRKAAHEPLEQVMVRYQHAAEAVLTQETIPRNYRDPIKQYFLAIGVMPDNRQ